MCGIYGLLSPSSIGQAPGDELFETTEEFLRVSNFAEATTPDVVAAIARCEELLSQVHESVARWSGRGAFRALASDPQRVEGLRRIADELGAWADSTVAWSSTSSLDIAAREKVNEIVIAVRDASWRLRHDILANLVKARALVVSPSDDALLKSYELNLVLNGLDRLEVRGRDSAGIAVFARFPEGALEAFLESTSEVADRHDHNLGNGAVIRPKCAPDVLLFAFKVAHEVGKMGDNVQYLRQAILGDELFQRVLCEGDVEIQVLAHTRWASNGVVSVPNCHPVDSAVRSTSTSAELGSEGRFVACLNGDIDNYQELVAKYVTTCELEIDPLVTTDAKIIPIVVAHFAQQLDSLEAAFEAAIAEFEGSMAIGLMAADRPGELFFAQKGSGQGLFFGLGHESVAVASEMYGVVELTQSYVKAEGEQRAQGELFALSRDAVSVDVSTMSGSVRTPLSESRTCVAEITTRDINRGDHPHFFVKEISESVDSVRNTFRGKFEQSADGFNFQLGNDVLPTELIAGFRNNAVREVIVMGQGTAAIAAQGVAHLVSTALEQSATPIRVRAEKATEFSAHQLRDDMSDVLVIAVSQSGTTTDTNRTVDLARQRGAWVVGIVNRRNSDLVYKSHGVLYTSDGRDIEMSVASTKAFYAQNVAGEVLALGLAQALGTLSNDEIRARTEELQRLPEVMTTTLSRRDEIREVAEKFALTKRHWAIVGSGSNKVAADEIRIKLSELCYKSIAVDYIEDKKHIDLSSEPLVLVCASGQREEIVSDVVKEVAIFKAHQATPIVIIDEDETRFDAYAAGVIRLPRLRGALSYLPTAIAGHLFGYYAAASMDLVADKLRRVRASIVSVAESREMDVDVMETIAGVSDDALAGAAEIDARLVSDDLDGALGVGLGVRLSRAIQFVLGRSSIDALAVGEAASESPLTALLSVLSEGVSELARPIDAIKHQAKTVTVGISRGGDGSKAVFVDALSELGIEVDQLAQSHRIFLEAFSSMVDAVEGATLYEVSGLDALGRPTDSSTIRVEQKRGCARDLDSRADVEVPLTGNKWASVKAREIYLGKGQSDDRRVLILPCTEEAPKGRVALFHFSFSEDKNVDEVYRALRARPRFGDELRAAVTERGLEWSTALLESLDQDVIFFSSPDELADQIAHTHSH